MRFPKQALEELKRIDPETPIKVGYIRKLVHTGVIPSVAIGKRRLLNLDSLLDYLANPPAETPAPVRPGIRRIDERCWSNNAPAARAPEWGSFLLSFFLEEVLFEVALIIQGIKKEALLYRVVQL